jgi:hypothetical protein
MNPKIEGFKKNFFIAEEVFKHKTTKRPDFLC